MALDGKAVLMMSSRFLIAKYVSDLRRMEPRNIGIIVWSNGSVSARFLGESNNGTYKITPPTYLDIQSGDAYQQWIHYWRRQTEKETIMSKAGLKVQRSDPKFVQELIGKSREQYFLTESGIILETVKPGELEEIADELFSELVLLPNDGLESHEKVTDKNTAKELKLRCSELMANTAIKDRKDYWQDWHWLCPVGDTKQHFKFDFALYDTQPRMVFMRVPLADERSVYSTAFRFEQMRKAYELPKEKCAALVLAKPGELVEQVLESYELMDSIGTVVNTFDIGAAANQLLSLVA